MRLSRIGFISVPAFRNDDFTEEHPPDHPDGVPAFWFWILPLGNMWQQDVPLIEFSEGWDWAKAQMQKDVCQNFKMMEKIFLMPYRKNTSGLFSIFLNQKTWLHKKQSSL